jgi:formate-dependent nitrite reductase cytochrome c552 subunit
MKKLSFLFIFGLGILFIACQSKKTQLEDKLEAGVEKIKTEADKLKEEAFKIHDDVMPISMDLENLREEVMKKAGNDAIKKAKALEISKELDEAYKDMETWMPKLGSAADLTDAAEKIKALTEAKAEGLKIKEKTLAVKQKAEEFLK